jgi:hypothetical protein
MIRPSEGRDGRIYAGDFSKSGSGIFFARGLDKNLVICPTGTLPRSHGWAGHIPELFHDRVPMKLDKK